MCEFADIERRINAVCSPGSIDGDPARMLSEIGDVLAVGYVAALRADAACRRLASDLDHADSADEIRRLVSERRTIEDASRALRARLGLVRALFAHVSARVAAA